MDFKKNSKAIYEIAVVAAAMTFLGGLGLVLVPLYFLATLLLPIPLAFLIVRRNLYHGLGALAITTALLVLATGSWGNILLMALQFGSVGIFIGLLLKNQVAVDKSMAVLFFWSLLLGGLNILVIYLVSSIGASGVAAESYAFMERTSDFYLEKGIIDEAGRQQIMEAARGINRLVQVLVPGSMAVWTILMTMFTYFMTRRLMRKLNYSLADEFKFTRWQLPWYSIWLVIVGLAMVMAGEQFSLTFLNIAGSNILFMAAFIFFVLGLAVLVYLLRVWKINHILKTAIILAAVFYFPFTAVLVLSLGVADPVANLRRLPREEDDEVKGGSD